MEDVIRDYPGGPPHVKMGRLLVHQVDYFGSEFPAPEWRKQWVEPIEAPDAD